jgi:glycosyltransferase involved in cell wall biosynthesis
LEKKVIQISETAGLVSVIIPAYNIAKHIGEAVESVLGQTYRQIETIVIDDGSTDGTLLVLERYGGKVRVVSQQNGGAGAARNRGILEATGEYLAFLDGDDIWYSDKLATQVAILSENKDVCLTSGMADGIDESGDSLDIDLNYKGDVYDRPLHLYNELLSKGNPVWTSSVVVRRAALKEAGYFDESKRRSQDYDMWIRLAEKNNFYIVGRRLGRYRWLRSSLTHGSITREYEAQLDILKKHSWRFQPNGYHKRLSHVYCEWAGTEFCYGTLRRGVQLTIESLRLDPFTFAPYVQMAISLAKYPVRVCFGRGRGLYERELQ